ncbi:MAG: thioredoxin domain-containing protein [Acidobacteriota bacterium]
MNPARSHLHTSLMALLLALPVALLAETHPPVTDYSKLKEVDWAGLSDAQKKTALKVMNENGCNCGCKMTIATCRDRDSSCRRSLIFARTVIDALREGKPEAEAVRTLKAKSDTFVEAKLPDDGGVAYSIDIAGSPARGPKDAPVVLVEFSDFQCPYCAGLQSTLDQVLKAFPKEVKLVFKQFPLNIHQYARQAAVASMAANAQGKFWPLHDRMFQNFSAINEENIKKWAREAGLNPAEFEKAMQSGKHESQVQKDIADGAAARVLGTPSLFINGKRVDDRSFEGFKKVILEELAAAKSSPATAPGKPTAAARTPGSR